MNRIISGAQVFKSKRITFNQVYLYPLSGGLGPENATNCCPIHPPCYFGDLAAVVADTGAPFMETSWVRMTRRTSPSALMLG